MCKVLDMTVTKAGAPGLAARMLAASKTTKTP
jgi:hypothetical protein